MEWVLEKTIGWSYLLSGGRGTQNSGFQQLNGMTRSEVQKIGVKTRFKFISSACL